MKREPEIEEIIRGFKQIKRSLFPTGTKLLGSDELTSSQLMLLAAVADAGPCTTKDIRILLGVTSSAATQLINGLVKKRYLRRQPHPTDGRVSVISMTPQVKKSYAELKRQKLRHLSRLFAVFTDDEFSRYVALHRKLIDSL